MAKQFAGTPTSIVHDWRRAMRDGVPVAVPCNGCTSCCRSALLVRLTDAEARRLPHEVYEGRKVLPHRGRDCALFDAEQNRCSIYETRPIACREYDCRARWLAGFRNTERGREMNERLESWRTEVHSDEDLGVIAAVWLKARELLKRCDADVQLAAGAGVAMAMLMSRKALEKLGRQARRGRVEKLLAILNRNAP